MTAQNAFSEIFYRQQAFAPKLRAEGPGSRKKRLRQLRNWILAHQDRLFQAAHADLGKPRVEFEAVEIFHVLEEINQAVRNLDNWMAPAWADATISMAGTRSEIHVEPKGVCLIISPWNYSFSLCIGPLVSALAAGNTAVVKPSELTPAMSALVAEMIEALFPPELVYVAEGDQSVSSLLLALPFDHIFFTGSQEVARIVMRSAAVHLASVTLELGGKSPAIVSETADVVRAAERIAAGKFVNAGQTCVAPDYVLVQKEVAGRFAEACVAAVARLFGGPQDWTLIASGRHAKRLRDLLEDAVAGGAVVIHGGQTGAVSRSFPPTLLTGVSPRAKLMAEEIFGPILPIITYDNLEEAIAFVNGLPKPLGLYLFSNSRKEQRTFTTMTTAGSMCINDCAIQFLHSGLPFGGVGASGQGKAHGHAGFLEFSNKKPVLTQRRGRTVAGVFYPPYRKFQERLLNAFFKLFFR